MATAIGGLTIDVDAPAGFDIAANDNDAFAVLTPTGDTQSGLYKINLVERRRDVRPAGARRRASARPGAALARGHALRARAADDRRAAGAIVTVLSAVPGTLHAAAWRVVSITGLNASEEVVDIDTRPATGELVGLTSTGRLVNINPLTGQTTLLSQVSIAIDGSVRAMDFNPITDRLRIIGDNGQNLSVVPDTGVATEETDLDLTDLIAAAYDAAGALYAMTSDVSSCGSPIRRRASARRSARTRRSSGRSTAFDISPVDGIGLHRAGRQRRPRRPACSRCRCRTAIVSIDRHVFRRPDRTGLPRRIAVAQSRPRALQRRELQRARERRQRVDHAAARGGIVRADHRPAERRGRHGHVARAISSASTSTVEFADGEDHEDDQRADRQRCAR